MNRNLIENPGTLIIMFGALGIIIAGVLWFKAFKASAPTIALLGALIAISLIGIASDDPWYLISYTALLISSALFGLFLLDKMRETVKTTSKPVSHARHRVDRIDPSLLGRSATELQKKKELENISQKLQQFEEMVN